MSSRSTGKKTLQSFHARTALWQRFVQRAEEMDCSVDYLVNEAMRQYAASQGFLETGTGEAPAPSPPRPGKEPPPTVRGKAAGLPRPGGGRAPAPPARRSEAGGPSLPRPGGSGAGQAPQAPRPPSMRPSRPPPPPRPSGDTGASGVQRPPLTMVFQGRKIPILQDQFIIGRGSKSSDLAIKDANISRKHAAVIFHNGAYYMKDLGSTNGIDFDGKPVDSKRIDEGDVFTVCGYDLHFTYSS